ncbi:MAG: hypothetical protein Q8P33_03520 [bacterium]|nr:hypothetical protein [bacterium]
MIYLKTPTAIYIANGSMPAILGAVQAAGSSASGVFSALLAGTAAAHASSPLLLVQTNVVPEQTPTYIDAHTSTIAAVVAVGSVSDVTDAVVQEILDLF